MRNAEKERIAHAFDKLSEVQKRRLLMLADEVSIREIARRRNVQHRAGIKSIETARNIFKIEYPKGCSNFRIVKV